MKETTKYSNTFSRIDELNSLLNADPIDVEDLKNSLDRHVSFLVGITSVTTIEMRAYHDLFTAILKADYYLAKIQPLILYGTTYFSSYYEEYDPQQADKMYSFDFETVYRKFIEKNTEISSKLEKFTQNSLLLKDFRKKEHLQECSDKVLNNRHTEKDKSEILGAIIPTALNLVEAKKRLIFSENRPKLTQSQHLLYSLYTFAWAALSYITSAIITTLATRLAFAITSSLLRTTTGVETSWYFYGLRLLVTGEIAALIFSPLTSWLRTKKAQYNEPAYYGPDNLCSAILEQLLPLLFHKTPIGFIQGALTAGCASVALSQINACQRVSSNLEDSVRQLLIHFKENLPAPLRPTI